MKSSHLVLIALSVVVPKFAQADFSEIADTRGASSIKLYQNEPNNEAGSDSEKISDVKACVDASRAHNNPIFVSPRLEGYMAAASKAVSSESPLYHHIAENNNPLFAQAKIAKSGLYSGVFSFKGTKAHSYRRGLKVTCTYSGPLTFSSGYFVNEQGKRVTVTIPSGSVLKGKSKGRSFVAKMRQGQDTHTLTVSKVTATSAKVALKIDSRFHPDASCSYSFAGSFGRQ